MTDERIETAIQRIEDALARIADVADSSVSVPASVSALVVKHETLRDTASNTLSQLDKLIAELEE